MGYASCYEYITDRFFDDLRAAYAPPIGAPINHADAPQRYFSDLRAILREINSAIPIDVVAVPEIVAFDRELARIEREHAGKVDLHQLQSLRHTPEWVTTENRWRSFIEQRLKVLIDYRPDS